MFCPQCGHQQASSDTRFCSRCGLSLGLATDLILGSDTQLQREKRELMGTGLMMTTVLLLMNFFLVFGLVTLPHVANPVFLWIWVAFLVTALGVGAAGLTNLIRGGFFKRLKERDARLRLMNAEKQGRIPPEEAKTKGLDSEATPPLMVAPASVTETTTRELEPNHSSRSNR